MTYKPEPNMTEKQVQKEVQRQAVLFEEQVRNGQVSSDGRLKLSDFVPMYLKTARQKLSPYVYERYTHILNIGIIPALGHLKLKDIRPLHIQRFIDDLSKRDTHLDGKPMYPTTPTQWFSKFQKRNDLPHRKFHSLRHTSATLLVSNGTNIKNVASRLGHTQLKTTNRYVHAVDQAERQAANTLELILGGNRKTG